VSGKFDKSPPASDILDDLMLNEILTMFFRLSL
jgi:hypothetical protein